MPDGIKTIVDTRVLRHKLNKFRQKLAEPMRKEIPLYLTWFTQSVVKETPPKSGKGKKVLKSRPIINLDEPRFSVENQGYNKYLIPMRGKRYLTKFAKTAGQAKKYAKITYRFLAKFGWLASANPVRDKKFNVAMPAVQPEVKAMESRLAKYRKRFNTDKPYVIIINTVKGISRFASIAAFKALKTTEVRIKGASNKQKTRKSYSKLWNKF